MYLCLEDDAVYNLILFQLRYIIFTCILRANVHQQSCVVKMYVGCIKRHQFYFLFYADLVARLSYVFRQMYFLFPPFPLQKNLFYFINFFFFFMIIDFFSVICGVHVCYCDMCQNATV